MTLEQALELATVINLDGDGYNIISYNPETKELYCFDEQEDTVTITLEDIKGFDEIEILELTPMEFD